MYVEFATLWLTYRNEPTPPEPCCLVADVDASLGRKILDLAQRKRVAQIHHRREVDDFGRRVEVAKRILHPTKLRTTLLS